ncbi:hypothetical protein VTO73DRAFT_3260, partial [Trametes versicolor]
MEQLYSDPNVTRTVVLSAFAATTLLFSGEFSSVTSSPIAHDRAREALLMQVYGFSKRFKGEIVALKILVSAVFILATTQQALISAIAWYVLASGSGIEGEVAIRDSVGN